MSQSAADHEGEGSQTDLDEVEHDEWRAILLQELIEMPSGSRKVWVDVSD